jgi:hypothetical protein
MQIDRYLAGLDELGYSGSTRKRKAITFRSFLFFLFRSGYISHDISKQVILLYLDLSLIGKKGEWGMGGGSGT